MNEPVWWRLNMLIRRWEDDGKIEWTSHEVVAALNDVTSEEVSQMIQRYLQAQRNKKHENRPDRAIHRVRGTRTSRAVWRTGNRTVDARDVAHSFANDVLAKYERTTHKDVRAMVEGNKVTAARFASARDLLEMQVEVFVKFLDGL